MALPKARYFAIIFLVVLVCLQLQWFSVATFEGQSTRDTKTISSPDSSVTATLSNDDAITLANKTTGSLHRLLGQKGVQCLAFSPDGKFLAAGGLDNSIWLWEVPSGQRRLLENPSWLGETSVDYPTLVGFSPDGKTLAAIVDERVGLWDVESGKHTATLGSGFRAVTFTSNGKFVALLEKDKQVRIIEEAYAGVILISALVVGAILLLRSRGLRLLSRRSNGVGDERKDRRKAGRRNRGRVRG